MSLDLYTFVDQLPDRPTWQAAIDQTGVDLKLDPALDLARDAGFLPCEIQGKASGFELTVAPAAELLSSFPSLAAEVGTRPHVMCFRWGGDLAESACVLGANLALLRSFRAVVYYPADDIHYDVAGLEQELLDCLAEL